MAHGGKGSRPRPFSVDQTTFNSNWDLAFAKNKKEQAVIDEISKLVAEETLQETENRITDNSKESQ
jgi:hypothetical protein